MACYPLVVRSKSRSMARMLVIDANHLSSSPSRHVCADSEFRSVEEKVDAGKLENTIDTDEAPPCRLLVAPFLGLGDEA
jgi:hypothetical protein